MPKQTAAEKAYQREYYQKNRERILKVQRDIRDKKRGAPPRPWVVINY